MFSACVSINCLVLAYQSRACKAFRRVETLFVHGRNLYLAGLLLDIQGLFTFRQPIASLQGTGFYLGWIKFVHVERPYCSSATMAILWPRIFPPDRKIAPLLLSERQQSPPIGDFIEGLLLKYIGLWRMYRYCIECKFLLLIVQFSFMSIFGIGRISELGTFLRGDFMYCTWFLYFLCMYKKIWYFMYVEFIRARYSGTSVFTF